MAKIVLGLGSSHAPLVHMPSKYWRMQGDAEMKNFGPVPAIYGGGGVEELRRIREPKVKDELTEERLEEKFQAAQVSVAKLRKALAEAKPDVLVTIAGDHQNLFLLDHMPALTIYKGETIKNPKVDESKPMPEYAKTTALWGIRPLDRDEEYPGQPELASHVVKSLIAQEFDVNYLSEPREGRLWAGGFTFVNRRLMPEGSRPMVPVILNTSYPPNSPSAKRCWDLGVALAKAIDSWDSNKTVGIVVSGGMAHPIVDEELDRRCLEAMVKNDKKTLTSIKEDVFVLTNGVIKSWITGTACLAEAGFKMTLLDYIPGYRSLAGTGCGLAFAEWHRGTNGDARP